MAAAAIQIESFEARAMAQGISRCAIAVTPSAQLSVEPILAAESNVVGRYQFEVTAISAGGRSTSRQANSFKDGTFSAPRMNFNADARVEALFEVTDPTGKVLCSVEIHYPPSATALNQNKISGGIYG